MIPSTLINGVPHWPCKICKALLPRDAFYFQNGVRNTYCKVCHNKRGMEYQRRRRAAHLLLYPAPARPPRAERISRKARPTRPADDSDYQGLLLDMHARAEAAGNRTFRELMTEALHAYLARPAGVPRSRGLEVSHVD